MSNLKLQQLIELKEKYISMMKNDGKEIITQWLIQLSEFVPDIEAFTWTQYTPSFNDGDPCTFYRNSIYYFTFGMRDEWRSYESEAYKADLTLEELMDEDDGDYLSAYSTDSPFYGRKDIIDALSGNDELFEYVFGDGSRVIATPIREDNKVVGFEYAVSEYYY